MRRSSPLTTAVAELQDVLAVVGVHRLAEFPPERDVAVVVDHRVVGHDAPAKMDGNERRDDSADAALGELRLPVDACLVAGAVVVVESSRDVRSEDAVLDCQVAELQGLKDFVKRHDQPPVISKMRSFSGVSGNTGGSRM